MATDRLYPPIIDSKLAPLVLYEKDDIEYIKTNISFDYGVDGNSELVQMYGMSLKISEAMSNIEIANIPIPWKNEETINTVEKTIKLNIEKNKFGLTNLVVGNFYKIQLAFNGGDSNNKGYFSTYGVAKFLDESQFSISFEEFDEQDDITIIQNGLSSIIGKFVSEDLTELEQSYEFNLYDGQNLIETSGVQMHNNSSIEIQDHQRITQDVFKITTEPTLLNQYVIEYKIYTINGYELSIRKSFSRINLSLVNFGGEVFSENCSEEGYNKVYCCVSKLFGKSISAALTLAGTYKLFRSDDKDGNNFSVWEHIGNFTLPSLRIDNTNLNNNITGNIIEKYGQLIYIDYLIEQGINYKYSVSVVFEQNANGQNGVLLESNRIIQKDPTYTDFETAYLYDKNYQLAIKYNPKISSFKTTKLESKIDTIGSIYPYFTRNDNTNYKEFPISGLISILMDDQKMFANGLDKYNEYVFNDFNGNLPEEVLKEIKQQAEKHNREATNSLNYPDDLEEGTRTDLTSKNFKTEREFKLAVLDWLNNGQLKVFKSAGEGNYIVRLMNVVLTPNDTLGRMLHTFSCTAYEAAPYTLRGLIDSDLFEITNKEIKGTNLDGIWPENYSTKETDTSNYNIYIYNLSEYNTIEQIDFFDFPIGAEIKGYDKYSADGEGEPLWTIYNFNNEFSLFKNGNYKIENLKMITSNQINYKYENILSLVSNQDRDEYIFTNEQNISKDNKIKVFIASRLRIRASSYNVNAFNLINSIKYDQVVIKQYISESFDVNNNQEDISRVFCDDKTSFNFLTDLKQQSNQINKIIIKKRKIDESLTSNENLKNLTFYEDRVLINPLAIYGYRNQGIYYTQDIYGIVHEYSNLNCTYKINGDEVIEGTLSDGEVSFSALSNITSIELGNGLYCELAYPVIRLNYQNEQPWRDNNDYDILCGYYQDNNAQKYYIGFNCYNINDIENYKITQMPTYQDKMRENGKYLADRHFIVDRIDQMINSKEQKGI